MSILTSFLSDVCCLYYIHTISASSVNLCGASMIMPHILFLKIELKDISNYFSSNFKLYNGRSFRDLEGILFVYLLG